ncbi:hypothetical protein KIPB_012632, partial [Kipferlia bialata]
RIVTGLESGQVTLWDGVDFRFLIVIQAFSRNPVLCLKHFHTLDWFIIGDSSGRIRYNDNTLNFLNEVEVHQEAINEVSMSPSDQLYVTGSQDKLMKIVDTYSRTVISSLVGHRGAVRGVDWHPSMSLIASGSEDRTTALWDPKAMSCIHSFKDSMQSVEKVQWDPSGTLLATCCNDQHLRLYDVRTMTMLKDYRWQGDSPTCVTFHPRFPGMFSVGDSAGSISFFDACVNDGPEANGAVFTMPGAHNPPSRGTQHRACRVNCLQYHPLGHLMASGGRDKALHVWCRHMAGDNMRDIFHKHSFDPSDEFPASGYIDPRS